MGAFSPFHNISGATASIAPVLNTTLKTVISFIQVFSCQNVGKKLFLLPFIYSGVLLFFMNNQLIQKCIFLPFSGIACKARVQLIELDQTHLRFQKHEVPCQVLQKCLPKERRKL